MSLLRKCRCKREATKCHYAKKRDAKAQAGYWRGAYGKMRAALEARIKHNTLKSAFVILKSRKQGRTLFLATIRSACSVPFRSGFY